MKKRSLVLTACLLLHYYNYAQTKIDRKALVERHTIINNKFDSLSSLSVGNGSFAFTVDITGLQSFPDAYAKGVPLGTESVWGWHSFIDTANYQFNETLKDYEQGGRKVSYSVQVKQPLHSKNAVDWFRQNPHRLQLGNIGFEIIKKDGSLATISDIQNIQQTLNLWTGEIHSRFSVENTPVDVITYCHQQQDIIAVKIISALLNEKRLQIRIRFPSPNGDWKDVGNSWHDETKQQSFLVNDDKQDRQAGILRLIDSTEYFVGLNWSDKAVVQQKVSNYFLLIPEVNDNTYEFVCRFSLERSSPWLPSFPETRLNNVQAWKQFWQSGAAIDFSGSKDPRAKELERRIVLSQWLTKIQCSNQYPPQETGLTYNSWYGKPHLEMHWWHAYHYALWGRIELLEKSLAWYKTVFGKAKAIAQRQGYVGVRWQKMTDNEGRETPSSVGALLIWQQPHVISFAELCYRDHHNNETLEKYKDIVFATADFMASFAYYDPVKGKYILGKGVIPAQERFKAEETFNPTYELVYWHWALNIAQQWRERLGLPRNKKWDEVLAKLSPLPVQDNKYLFTESATDSYTSPEFRTDHPSVLGGVGHVAPNEYA